MKLVRVGKMVRAIANQKFVKANYKITPEEELHALVWYGKMCSDKSEIAAEAFFPVTEEGRAALLQWLEKEFARCPQ